MGLFDSAMFSPSGYNGLLGDLLSRLQFQQPEPSQGFSDGQGSYGGIPYPIFGQPEQQAAIPPQAQPTQYQAQQQSQPQLPTALQPPSGGNFGAGMQGFFNASSPMQAIGNMISGFSTGQRTDPSGMAQQTAQAVYQALRTAGVPDGVAQAAALNPEVLKTIAPQIYQKPELKDTGTDPLTGQKNFAIYEPNRQTLTAVNPGGPQANSPQQFGSQAFYDKIAQMQQGGAPQEQLLQEVPSSYRGYVKSLLKGEAIPANLGRPGPARAAVIAFAHAIDPNFDEAIIPQRVAYARSFGQSTPSSVGGQITISGTVVKHLGDAFSALPAIEAGLLGQTDTLNQLNPVKDYLRSQSGDKAFLDAKGKYETAAKGIAGELERLLSGSHGAEASKQYWLKRLGLDASPTERRAALDEVRNLMYGRLSNVAQQKDRAFGGQTDPLSLLGPEEQKIARAITAGTYSAGQEAPQVQRAINPKTGQTLILKNGQWVPEK